MLGYSSIPNKIYADPVILDPFDMILAATPFSIMHTTQRQSLKNKTDNFTWMESRIFMMKTTVAHAKRRFPTTCFIYDLSC